MGLTESDKRDLMFFLEHSRAYENFVFELHSQKGISFRDYVDKFKGYPKGVISGAFNWHGSHFDDIPSGNYWMELNEKWLEHLK